MNPATILQLLFLGDEHFLSVCSYGFYITVQVQHFHLQRMRLSSARGPDGRTSVRRSPSVGGHSLSALTLREQRMYTFCSGFSLQHELLPDGSLMQQNLPVATCVSCPRRHAGPRVPDLASSWDSTRSPGRKPSEPATNACTRSMCAWLPPPHVSAKGSTRSAESPQEWMTSARMQLTSNSALPQEPVCSRSRAVLTA